MQSAEPFFEAAGPVRDVLGATAYRIGYRAQGTGQVLAVIEIPAEVVEEAVASKLSASVMMSPNGDLAVATGAFSFVHACYDTAPIAIDVLVVQVVAPENLRLEEAGPEELRMLLVRLERSVTIVNDALARWGAP